MQKTGNYSSIIAIFEKLEKLGNPTSGSDFSSYKETVKEVKNLKTRKVSQKTDFPIKIIMENIDIVSYSCIITLITRCHVLPFPLV